MTVAFFALQEYRPAPPSCIGLHYFPSYFTLLILSFIRATLLSQNVHRGLPNTSEHLRWSRRRFDDSRRLWGPRLPDVTGCHVTSLVVHRREVKWYLTDWSHT
jgi:hypothetical protein